MTRNCLARLFIMSKFNLKKDDGDAAIAMTAFGQGKLQVSPYYMAMLTSSIANNGILMKPYLVDQITSAQGETVEIRAGIL